jgi:23S rRNA pseudouridine1911/1915/1917 synthase
VGDKIYGRRKQSFDIDRHFLHAAKLKIVLPGKSQPQTFEAPLPEELVAVLDDMRGKK